MRNSGLRAQGGFSLIEVMVAVGVLGVLGYFITSIFQSSLKSATQSNVTVQADTFKRNLINVISNDGAWANTVKMNSALSCLQPLFLTPPKPATCSNITISPPPAGPGIKVQNAGPIGGTTVYDNTTVTNGFTTSGAPCANFSSAGNDQCPFQMNVTYEISCPVAPCTNPEVKATGVLTYAPVNPAFKVSFNAAKYGFSFVRGQLNGGNVGGSGDINYLTMWSGGVNPSNTLADSVVYQNGTNIGVGTQNPQAAVDVSGEIRPGNSGQACTSANEGATRYDLTKHKLLYCDVTGQWLPAGGFGTCVRKIGVTGSTWYTQISVSCDAGYTMTGGGCQTITQDGQAIYWMDSYPSADNTWTCSTAYTMTPYAICCK